MTEIAQEPVTGGVPRRAPQDPEERQARRMRAKFAEADRLAELNAHQRCLYEKLSRLRRAYAIERSVPAFQILGNQALIDLCLELPLTLESLAQISGIGHRRLEAYGPGFVELIRSEVLGQ